MTRFVCSALTRLPAYALTLGCTLYVLPQSALAAPTQPAPLPVPVAAVEPSAPFVLAVGTAEAGVSSSLVPKSTITEASDTSLPASIAAPSEFLPDAPSPRTTVEMLSASFAPQSGGQATPTVAPRLTKYIPAGWTAQSLTAHDKFLLGLRDLYSPLNFIAMLASAGYEQALNGEPNYGTDRGAFGQRLGAAAIRESSQGFFTDSVFSPLLHEDPRYYIKGTGHSFLNRTVYAVTRTLVTRTDNGGSSVNGALLVGYASSAALSYTYYPSINQNFHDTAATFGGSLGGAALGFFVSEFSDDVLKAVHLKK